MATKRMELKFSLILSIFLCLTGCSSNEFKEKEEYEFDYNKYIPLILESSLEIDEAYNMYYNDYYIDMNYNLTLYPAEEKEIVYSDFWSLAEKDILDYYTNQWINNTPNYFKEEDGYIVTPYYFMKSKIIVMPYKKENGKYEFRFAHTVDEYSHAVNLFGPYPFHVTPIKSNNSYAYYFEHRAKNFNPYSVIYMLATTINSEYDIYIVENNSDFMCRDLIMIPNNKDFSKKFIKYFNEDENVHYLDLNRMREELGITLL